MPTAGLIVAVGLTIVAHPVVSLADSAWQPPFPALQADVDCAVDFKPPNVSKDTKDALKMDWDDLSICGKHGASWKKLHCGSVCRIKLKDLRPTQASVGTAAVNCKARKMERKIDDDASYEKYFKKTNRLVPVVIGPNEKFYVLDHHHMSNALYRADINVDGKSSERELLGAILFNVSEDYMRDNDLRIIDQETFETALNGTAERENGKALLCTETARGEGIETGGVGMFWPCDKNGETITFSQMSETDDSKVRKIWKLDDDPLRSMSRWVRNSYGYVKCKSSDENVTEYCAHNPAAKGNPANFMEFQWANFMRSGFGQTYPTALSDLTSRITPGRGQLAAIARYLPDAIAMTLSTRAKAMIGYNGDRQVQPWLYPSATLSDDACRLDDSLHELVKTMGYED